MKNPTKKQIATRKRALTMRQRTNAWVVPQEISILIDKDKLREAADLLEIQKIHWPNDPEITYYDSLIHNFLGLKRKKR